MEGKVGTSGDLEKLSGSEGRCPECAAMDPGIGVPPLPLCQRVEIRSCPPPSALPLPSTPYISFAPCERSTSFPVPYTVLPAFYRGIPYSPIHRSGCPPTGDEAVSCLSFPQPLLVLGTSWAVVDRLALVRRRLPLAPMRIDQIS